MQQYNVRITNTAKIVLTLVFTPLIVMPVIFVSAAYGPAMPDWAIFAGISALLVTAIVLTVFLTRKMSPKGVVTLEENGFRVDFPERSIFAPRPFEVKMNEVKNFFGEEKDELYYMSFTTSAEPKKFNIEARSKEDEDLATFTELMTSIARMVEKNNEVHGNDMQTIAHVSMYEKGWAKILAAGVIFVVTWVVYLKLFMPKEQAPSWWRLTAVLIFGVPFLHQVYYYNYGEGKKKQSQ